MNFSHVLFEKLIYPQWKSLFPCVDINSKYLTDFLVNLMYLCFSIICYRTFCLKNVKNNFMERLNFIANGKENICSVFLSLFERFIYKNYFIERRKSFFEMKQILCFFCEFLLFFLDSKNKYVTICDYICNFDIIWKIYEYRKKRNLHFFKFVLLHLFPSEFLKKLFFTSVIQHIVTVCKVQN